MTITPKLTSYHFDCGNSNTGPVGFCARVRAESREEALTLLQEAIAQSEFDLTEKVAAILADDSELAEHAIEYLNVYFNAVNIALEDSDPEADEIVGDHVDS